MKLVILNGPCGVGKSTAAKPLHEAMPLSFLIDIDALHGFIADWTEDKDRRERWEVSIAVAKAIMKTVFAAGHSVVIDKMIYAPDVLDELEAIGQRFGAEMTEIVLWADKETVMKRAEQRGFKKGGRLTPIACETFWHKIDALKAERPKAHVIDTTKMNKKQVQEAVEAIVFKKKERPAGRPGALTRG